MRLINNTGGEQGGGGTEGIRIVKNTGGEQGGEVAGGSELIFSQGSASGNTVTIDDKQMCIITTDPLTTFAGATENITLISNKIFTTSKFLTSVKLWTSSLGLPVILDTHVASGQVLLTVLNIIGQNSSSDFNGTLILTIIILN